ncbi:MAG: carboxymuconolactone decarboxylase family protein [Anaerolineae bacterium]|nr:carboxymuconolactone decarboxylase family protein [Anaerolineae bacterium]
MQTQPRLEYDRVNPQAYNAMLTFSRFTRSSIIEKPLLELVRVRASQINGCAYCVDMHTKDARAGGETEQRLYALSVWRETPFYSERERAALEWTEAITLISDNHVSDELYALVNQHFSEAELVDLTVAIIVINGWNRLAIPFRDVAGTYEPAPVAQPADN